MILVVGLIVLGPDKLPEFARKAGRVVRDFRRMTSGVTREMTSALGLDGEDDGKSIMDDFNSVKEDLSALRKSLNEDADQLKGAVASEAKQIQNSIKKDTGGLVKDTEELVSEISKENIATGQEIKESLSELNSDIQKDVSQLKQTLAEDSKHLSEAVEKGTLEFHQTLEEQTSELKQAVESPIKEETVSDTTSNQRPDATDNGPGIDSSSQSNQNPPVSPDPSTDTSPDRQWPVIPIQSRMLQTILKVLECRSRYISEKCATGLSNRSLRWLLQPPSPFILLRIS